MTRLIQSICEKISSDLQDANEKNSAREHTELCTKKSLVIFVVCLGTLTLFAEDFAFIFAASAFAGAAAFYFLFFSPSRKLAKKAREIEKEIPMALMQVSTEINTGISFNESIRRTAKGNYGVLSEELLTSLNEAEKTGITLQKALLRRASKNRSRVFSRAISQLASFSVMGSKNIGVNVRKIALELMAKQRSALIEYSSKASVFSIAFVAVSAILPSLFQSFVLIGSSFMEMPFTPPEVIITITLLMPACDIAMLYAMAASKPI